MSNGDLEGNPRPMEKTSNRFSCCHWNANSILPRNTFPLLTAYNTAQRFDIICALEIYLNFLFDDKTIEIPGYNLLRANYPNNEKMGGVCLYFKENLCLRQIDIQNKKGYIVDLCRSRTQISAEFNNSQCNFDKILSDVKQLVSTF